MKRIAGDTRTAIIAAAAAEFAAHGFAGASVDAIAARSRFNKAMIYYHFRSKQGLYVEILRDGFRSVGARAAAIADADLAPTRKVAAFIDVFNEMAANRPYMPPMMMREMAEGATRLDAGTLRLMSRIFESLARILDEGARLGAFQRVDPLLAYFSMIAPVIFFRASAPLREAFGRRHIVPFDTVDADAFVAHHKAAVLKVLAAGTPHDVSAGTALDAARANEAGATQRPGLRKSRRTRSSRPGVHA